MTAPALRAVPADDEALDAMALGCDAADAIPFGAAVLSWPGFSAEEMEQAWQQFAEALRKVHALDSREVPWHEHYAEADLPPGMDLQDAAVQKACEEADDARRYLVAGAGS